MERILAQADHLHTVASGREKIKQGRRNDAKSGNLRRAVVSLLLCRASPAPKDSVNSTADAVDGSRGCAVVDIEGAFPQRRCDLPYEAMQWHDPTVP